MYRMGLMSLLASDCGVDGGRCMRMSLVHDVAEALVGDITPHCNVSDADKHAMEADAVQQIKAMLGPATDAGALGREPADLARQRQATRPHARAPTRCQQAARGPLRTVRRSWPPPLLPLPLLQRLRWRRSGTSTRRKPPPSPTWSRTLTSWCVRPQQQHMT